MASITSVELNYLVFRYLQESGFTHSAFTLGYEAGINTCSIDGNLIPPAALIRFVHKGLQYLEMEANLSNSDVETDEDFSFLHPLDIITKDVNQLQQLVKERRKNRDKDRDREVEREYEEERGQVMEKERQEKEKEHDKDRKKELADTDMSIWAAKGILQDGMCWRVGNGERILVIGAAWVPRSDNRKIQTVSSIPDSMMVADFIVKESRLCNEELIRTEVPSDDFLVWKGEASGDILSIGLTKCFYSYRAILIIYSSKQNMSFCKKLWGLNLPSKLKITTWKCCKNYITTLCNLQYRRLINEVVCPKCAASVETHEHVFRQWHVTRYTYRCLNVCRPEIGDEMRFMDWVTWYFASNTIAEAPAYVRGLQLDVTMGVREMEVKGDARSVIKKIQSKWADKSEIQAYISNYQDLSNSFQTCVFLFGHRSKNEIAHLLATKGLCREEQWNLDRGFLFLHEW
ncbi:hypothetical protein CXB51_028230 [Gossypium anomalum]|uniref:LisH domain-containing protein n=1 Tax=Gossypium anomalum TaxID=47600 RepID=A0A8J5XXP1_9ROSI|nr:hypothetical protein CXB51_028230 [Gossypium anomalum]